MAKDQAPPSGIMLEIPGRRRMRITHVVFDFNGTLATEGKLIPGVKRRLERLARLVEVIVLTADTFGTARGALAGLPVAVQLVRGGSEKRRFVAALGRRRVAVVGNGTNDVLMFKVAALGLAVCGAEGMAAELARAATVLVHHINDALDLLLRTDRLRASLRR